MPISLMCQCGRTLTVPDGAGGKRARCPACGAIMTVPFPAEPVEPPVEPSPAAPVRRTYGHALLLLALAPLVIFTFKAAPEQTAEARLNATIQAHPEIGPKIDALVSEVHEHPIGRDRFLDALFDLLPGRRMQGALLPYGSHAHWLMAAAAGAVFLALALLIFPGRAGPPQRLALVGLFTGTVGILFLLGVQWVAFSANGYWINGAGVIVLIFYIVKFIGFSYAAALGQTGIVLSFLGFTCGVGFCEEVCKVLPLAWWSARRGLPSWRFACTWGMVSGFGFGISEAITYAGDHYNGIESGGVYLVRFVSCVALHGIWAACAGITFYRNRKLFHRYLRWYEWLLNLLRVVAVPMVLHGAYDTLLKKEMSGLALVVALVSFAYLAFLIETSSRRPEPAPQPSWAR